MSLQNKLSIWVQNALITEDQKQKIFAFEKENNNGFAIKTAFIIAGLFIGLGICLIVASNWQFFPSWFKFLLNFAVFGAFVYGVFWSVQNNKPHLKDLFLFLSFLMIAATIGLTAQTFNLNGGWQSFALFWSLLSLPYVLLSSSFSFNLIWMLLLSSAVSHNFLEEFFTYCFENIEGLACLTLLTAALSYAGELVYDTIKKSILLPRAFAKLMLFLSYVCLISFAFHWALPSYYKSTPHLFLGILFVAAFLTARLFWAFKKQDMSSFKHNVFLSEAYIFLFFASLFDDLLYSGFGFIISGFSILLLLYIFKKTSKYIKKLEIFK